MESLEKHCLTIDTRDVNVLGSGRFRTNADNCDEQISYYNRNKTDTSFNSFLAAREQISQTNDITFLIVRVIDNLNKTNTNYSVVINELNSFKNDVTGRTIQSISGGSIGSRADSTKPRRKYDGRRASKRLRLLSRK